MFSLFGVFGCRLGLGLRALRVLAVVVGFDDVVYVGCLGGLGGLLVWLLILVSVCVGGLG